MNTSLPPPTGDEYRDLVRISDRQALAFGCLWVVAELVTTAASLGAAAAVVWLFT
jgi:hypothetical protein